MRRSGLVAVLAALALVARSQAGDPEAQKLPKFEQGAVCQVRFSQDHKTALLVGAAGMAAYDLDKKAIAGTSDAVSGKRVVVALSGDGKKVLSSAGPDGLQLFELPTLKSLWTLKPEKLNSGVVAISGDGKTAVACGEDDVSAPRETLWIIDAETGKKLDTLDVPFVVRTLALSKDGTQLASCGMEKDFKKVVLVHELPSKKQLHRIKITGSNIDRLEYRADGTLVHIGIAHDDLQVFDLKAGKVARTLDMTEHDFTLPKGDERSISEVHGFTADEKLFAASYSKRGESVSVVFFDAKTKKVVRDLKAVGQRAAVSSDGERVIGVTTEGDCVLYELSGR